MTQQTLYLLRSLPGAGKSTLACDMAESMGIMYYEADMYFYDICGNYNFDASKLGQAHHWCQDAARKELEEGMSVIVSNTSTTEKEVDVYQQMAQDTGSRFISLIVENRHGNKSVHDVPPEKIAQMRQRFSVKL